MCEYISSISTGKRRERTGFLLEGRKTGRSIESRGGGLKIEFPGEKKNLSPHSRGGEEKGAPTPSFNRMEEVGGRLAGNKFELTDFATQKRGDVGHFLDTREKKGGPPA